MAFYPCPVTRTPTDVVLQRHVLVKGCGKAVATADAKEIGSDSGSLKSEHSSPIITVVS